MIKLSMILEFRYQYDMNYSLVQTHPGSFGTSSVPGGKEVIIDCVDPKAGVVAGLSIMIICR